MNAQAGEGFFLRKRNELRLSNERSGGKGFFLEKEQKKLAKQLIRKKTKRWHFL